MWEATVCTSPSDKPWLAISLDMDPLTLDLTRKFCDAVYETLKNRVIDNDLRDVTRLVDLLTDFHQIIQEESRKGDKNESQPLYIQ